MFICRKTDRRARSADYDVALNANTEAGLELRVKSDRRQKDPLDFMGLFFGVPSHLAYELLERCAVVEFASGDLVLSPAEENDSICILLSGHLKVHLGTPESKDFFLINPGDCIGEMSIIDGKPVSAFVIAESACRVLKIHQNEFWGSLSQIPDLVKNLLATLVDRMRTSNKSVLTQLQAKMEYEHIQKELTIAREIQASLLPAQYPLFPDCNEVDLFSIMNPAKSLGGDFYDAFFVAPTKLFIVVGDVSGKGIAAALFMVQSIMHLKEQALLKHSPSEILDRVNNSLCKNNTAAMFVTIFCGILDTDTGLFIYSNGGHNPPLSDAITGTFDYIPVPKGIVVGIMEDVKYQSSSLQLKAGDAIFVYTDGVTEAEDSQKKLFSDEKLLNLLAVSKEDSAEKLVELVKHEIDIFTNGVAQSDDITMLTLRYLGSNNV